jgi:hypothetical protein
MLDHRSFARRLCSPLLALALVCPSVALAAPKDKAATKLATDAMQSDYVGTKFKKAEEKLKKALKQCGASACSDEVVGRLHRDLATVYIAGLKQAGKGKAEMKAAVAADPELQLDKDFTTPEVQKAFKAAGGKEPKEEAAEEPEPTPEPEEKKEDCEPGSKGCDKEAPPEKEKPEPDDGPPKNWISLSFGQDFLLYGAKDDVCASNARMTSEAAGYTCFQNGQQFGFAPGQDIAPGNGNHVSGGMGRATSRILLGFDRFLTSNISLGLRVGYAFGGRPKPVVGDSFLPFHGELRVNYWFGTDGVRPYFSLSGGLAEVSGHVLVDYYDANTTAKGSLDAWRKTGRVFAGLGFGVMIPFTRNFGVVPELRVKQMFGTSGTSFDGALGLAYGF